MSTDPAALARGAGLPRLTSLRAFAAGIVFLYHLGHHTQWLPQEVVFAHGYVGVGFFFILSGFVLTWSTAPGSSVRDFYVRRVARVYPSHFVMALVALVVPATVYAVTLEAAVPNFLLLQAWFVDWEIVFGLNAVSWTLSCEAFFYLMAPWVIARARGSRAAVQLFLAWVLLCLVLAFVLGFSGQRLDILAYTFPLLRSGEFVLGVMLALLFESRGIAWRRPGLTLMVPVVVGLVLVGRPLPQAVVNALMVLPFALVVLAAAVADAQGVRSVLQRRALTYAGEVSFAFYLVHELVILNLSAVVGPGGTFLRGVMWCGVALVIASGLAVALHEGVERPMMRVIRRALLKGDRPSVIS